MRNAFFSQGYRLIWAGLTFAAAGGLAMAVEEAAYTVEKKDGDFEIRLYASQVVAETVVEGTMEQAGNMAFRPLFNYISGANRSKSKIAMTSPVGQQSEGEKIAMTAPVAQEAVGTRWAVTFMMPAGMTLDTLPDPTDSSVRLREVPPRRMAAVQYSGRWTRRQYDDHLEQLRGWMKANELQPGGAPVWARYNAPFTPWFMRRNEVLIPIAEVEE